MKIEVCLSPFDATWPDIRRAATALEESGISGLWVMDHLTGVVHERDHVLECFAVLAGLAHCTERARLGSLVVNCGLRIPPLLAQSAATVHAQSGGRLVLGLGAGGGLGTRYSVEMDVIGVGDASASIRRQRVTETVAVVDHLWSGASGSVHGEHFRVGAASGFLQPNPPPELLIAGFGPKMAAMAGRLASAFNTRAGLADTAALLSTAREAARAAGRQAFETSIFDDFKDAWLDTDSPERDGAAHAEADTLILVVPAPFDSGILHAIASATFLNRTA